MPNRDKKQLGITLSTDAILIMDALAARSRDNRSHTIEALIWEEARRQGIGVLPHPADAEPVLVVTSEVKVAE
jgi:hypothetical protein